MNILKIIGLAAILVSCASRPSYQTSINYDLPYGMYDSLELSTWEPNKTDCFGLALKKAYFGDKWASQVGLLFRGGSRSQLFVVGLRSMSEARGKVDLFVAWTEKSGETADQLLRTDIKFGELINLEIATEGDVINIIVDSTTDYQIELPFFPKMLTASTASTQSFIGFQPDKCPSLGRLSKTGTDRSKPFS